MEIVDECKELIKDYVAEIVKRHMEGAGKVFCKTIPMLVEPEETLYWKK